jgi:hypothetical protein
MNGYCRYLDHNHISGTLNITQLFARGLVQLTSKNASSDGLRILSLMNNTISNVIYPAGSIGDILKKVTDIILLLAD